MHPQAEAAEAAEWSVAAMALRAIFGRQQERDSEAVELRVSVTPNALPGLAVIEWELITPDGLAVTGGAL